MFAKFSLRFIQCQKAQTAVAFKATSYCFSVEW